MFDLGNNVDHVGLRMTIPPKQVATPIQNANEMDGQIVTPTHILAEELAMVSEGDDDEQDQKDFATFESKSNHFQPWIFW
jgi:hypothetical protein